MGADLAVRRGLVAGPVMSLRAGASHRGLPLLVLLGLEDDLEERFTRNPPSLHARERPLDGFELRGRRH